MSRLAISPWNHDEGHAFWYGAGAARSPIEHSGIPGLDDLLPGGGWRRGAITEILSDNRSETALNIIRPALAGLSLEKRWLCWVAPPHFIHTHELAHAGIDISRVLLVHPRNTANGLWLVEQALRAGTCGAVMIWMTGGDAGDLQRLQTAAEDGDSLGFVFRDDKYASQDSPVATRLLLRKKQQKLQLEVLPTHRDVFEFPGVLKISANALNRNRVRHPRTLSENHQHTLF